MLRFFFKCITLVNVYGPSSADKPDLFDRLSQEIEHMGNQLIIAGGDWNVLLNMNMDARNYKSVNRPRAGRNIIEMMELVDVWREVYLEKRGYTWRKFNTTKQGRLDYFLISEELLLEIHGIKIHASYRSDHSIVFLGLKTEDRKRSKQYWTFHNSLLKDNNYIMITKQLMRILKKQ